MKIHKLVYSPYIHAARINTLFGCKLTNRSLKKIMNLLCLFYEMSLFKNNAHSVQQEGCKRVIYSCPNCSEGRDLGTLELP